MLQNSKYITTRKTIKSRLGPLLDILLVRFSFIVRMRYTQAQYGGSSAAFARITFFPFWTIARSKKGLSNNTQRNYRQYLRVFFAWLDKTHNADLRPKDLTAKHVWDYRLYIARSYKTPAGGYLTKKSQNFYLIALRALLRYLAERDIETLPSTKIKLAKQKSRGAHLLSGAA